MWLALRAEIAREFYQVPVWSQIEHFMFVRKRILCRRRTEGIRVDHPKRMTRQEAKKRWLAKNVERAKAYSKAYREANKAKFTGDEYAKKQAYWRRKRLDKMTPQQRAADRKRKTDYMREYNRRKVAAMTPEENEARLQKKREQMARLKAKKDALTQRNTSQESEDQEAKLVPARQAPHKDVAS